jgi:TPP-dependent pyruvate/acetoin dehydrogenase alpha subunit
MAAKTKISADRSNKANSKDGSFIGDEKFKELYAAMLRCRALDLRARLLSRQDRFAALNLGQRGQEATEVGCVIDLREEDSVAAAGRDFMLQLIRGAPLRATLSNSGLSNPGRLNSGTEFSDAGKATSSSASTKDSVRKSEHAAAGGPFAVGARLALANKMSKKKGVVVAFSGDDSPSVRFWEETLALVSAQSLPILFVAQCVSPRGSSRLKNRQKVEDLSGQALRHGFPGIPVDRNDVVAVYRVAYESLARARRGGGPTLIECRPYRREDDTGPGRTERSQGKAGRSTEPNSDGEDRGVESDPIRYMEEYLFRKALFTKAWKKQLIDEFTRELDAAFETADCGRR